MESILISATIKPGRYEAVRAIVDEGPPFELPVDGIDRHCVFLHQRSIGFLFEGPPGLRSVVRRFLFDRSVLRQMQRIGVHLEGLPHEFDTVFRWSAVDDRDRAPRDGAATLS